MSNPTDFPDPVDLASGGRIKEVLEPIVKASIIVPESACYILYISKFDRAPNSLLTLASRACFPGRPSFSPSHFAPALLRGTTPTFTSAYPGFDSMRAGYFSAMMDLCFEHRGTDLDWHPMDVNASGDAESSRVLMTVKLPLAEIVTGFFDKLKSRSSGFASFECVFSVFAARGAPRGMTTC